MYKLDNLRAVACLMVVMLHTAAPYLYKLNEISYKAWMVGNFFDASCRVAVPLFFMISGHIFMSEKTPKAKNFLKIISALIFYSLLAVLYLKIFRGKDALPYIYNILKAPTFYHLWYFYSIFIFYIFASIIKVRSLNSKSSLCILIIIFIFLNPKLHDLTHLNNINYTSRFLIDGSWIYFLLYGVAGALLGHVRVNYKTILLVIYILASLAITFLTANISVEHSKYIGTYYNYNSILVFISAICLFIYFQNTEINNKYFSQFSSLISRNSLAIYGVHALFLDFFYRQGLRNFNQPHIDIPVYFIITIILSIIFGELLSRTLIKKHVT